MMAGATSGPLTDMTAVVVLTWCHCQPDQRGSSEPLFCMWGMFKGPPHVQTCRFDDVCVERRKIPSPSPKVGVSQTPGNLRTVCRLWPLDSGPLQNSQSW